MARRKLKTLPDFILSQVEEFSKEPKYMTATQFVVFNHKGIEVSVTLQRDSRDKVTGPGLFDKGELK